MKMIMLGPIRSCNLGLQNMQIWFRFQEFLPLQEEACNLHQTRYCFPYKNRMVSHLARLDNSRSTLGCLLHR